MFIAWLHTHTHTHTHIPHVCVQNGRSYRHIMEGGVGENWLSISQKFVDMLLLWD